MLDSKLIIIKIGIWLMIMYENISIFLMNIDLMKVTIKSVVAYMLHLSKIPRFWISH